MRMWMVDTKILCRKHLMGEHVETHMMIGSIIRGNKIDGFIENDLIQPRDILNRHNLLAKEMISRGYNHKSDIKEEDFNLAISKLSNEYINHMINKDKSLMDLITRCTLCKRNY